MKNYTLISAIALLFVAAYSYGFERLDRSVAIVGDDIVLESELDLKIALLKEVTIQLMAI